MRVRSYILFLFPILVCCSFAQISRVGTSAVNFLLIEPGPRAVAMGSAHVAMSGDTYLAFYNPAGLSEIESVMIDAQRTNWIADIRYDYLSIAFPVNRSVVAGFQFVSLSMADMEVRTEYNQNGTGEMFSAGDMLIGSSLSIAVSDRFSVGGTIKYVREYIWNMSADALAFDIGTRYSSSFFNTAVGVSISNFGESLKMRGRDINIQHDPSDIFYGNNDEIPAAYTLDEFAMPLTFRIGIASDLIPQRPGFLHVAIDAVHPYSTTEFINIGMELKPLEVIAFRAGYKSLFYPNSEEGLTFGAGLKIPVYSGAVLKVDIAFTDYGRFNSVKQFSLGFNFLR